MKRKVCAYIKCMNYWDVDKYPRRKWCRTKHQVYQWRLDNKEKYKVQQKRYNGSIRNGVYID